MIQDIDESLRALVKREALEGNGVEVAFDAPTNEWVSRRNAPSVDLYLYDIREDPRWFRLSYLVTAWTQRPEDEHRLLSAMLNCFIRNETMPSELLTGTLDGVELPVVLTAGLPLTDDRSIADVWSAMGGQLKPSIDLVVTAPMNVARAQSVGPPVLEEPILSVVQPESGKGKGRKRKAAAAERDTGIEPGEPGKLDETRRAGTTNQPGRTLRVRGV